MYHVYLYIWGGGGGGLSKVILIFFKTVKNNIHLDIESW